MRDRSLIFLLLLQLCACSPHIGQTGIESTKPRGTLIGNGGDVVDRFLDTTRRSLISVLDNVELKRKASPESLELCICHGSRKYDESCQILSSLTPPERAFCQSYLSSVGSRLAALARDHERSRFVITDTPFSVRENGQFRKVRAIALPDGEIRFHYESIKDLSPADLFFLIAHELGHQVGFPKEQPVADTLPYPPFSSGRQLLDTAAAALVTYATEHGFLGDSFAVSDRFSCAIRSTRFKLDYFSVGATPRIYWGGNRTRYETGVGNQATSFQCGVAEAGGSGLFVVLTVHEENGCGIDGPGSRWTHLDLVQKTPGQPDNLLSSTSFPGLNPTCGSKPYPWRMAYPPGELEFEVRFEGSAATTTKVATE